MTPFFTCPAIAGFLLVKVLQYCGGALALIVANKLRKRPKQ